MILERYNKGTQIGFEDPEESQYYESIGRINMYDYATIAGEGDNSLQHYFKTLPMAIMEINDGKLYVTRSNQGYRAFMERTGAPREKADHIALDDLPITVKPAILSCISKGGEDGKSVFLNERIPDGAMAHTIFKRVADNPKTGSIAVAFVIINITEDNEDITYSNIARSLAADYTNLFYVNLKTEEYIEYSSEPGELSMAAEKRGKNFFKTCIEDAPRYLYKDDVDEFISSFSKSKIMFALDNRGVFSLVYRMMIDKEPVFVNMKAMRMDNDEDHIVIGVSVLNR
jgi:hypothetical protein